MKITIRALGFQFSFDPFKDRFVARRVRPRAIGFPKSRVPARAREPEVTEDIAKFVMITVVSRDEPVSR